MPTLNWIGKEAVVKHHKDVPFRLLEPVPELSCGPVQGDDKNSGNLIVQGDNLHALKSLLPRYAGQVKCIYIDPPYNTGNEGWVYNDNVNSLEIRKWLGEVVGKEGETLDRHDRWLSMMYPRLVLLRQFLREDGAIFVSIDDNEVGNLQALMREVFAASNEVATIVWEKGKKGDSKLVSVTHEYIVAFARNKALLKERKVRWRRKKPGIDAILEHYESLRKKHGDDHTAIRKEMMAWYRALPKGDPRKGHKHYNWSDKRGLYFAALYDRDHCIGHAYLTGLARVGDGPQRFAALATAFRQRIVPLLEEYFFEDWRKIRLVLGDNQKRDVGLQFVAEGDAHEQDLTALFGNDHGLDSYATKRRYSLRESAFDDPAAYIGIYQAGV